VRRIRIRKPWLRLPPIALAALVLAGTASAAPAGSKVRIGGIDTSSYPELRVTVVAPAGAAQPRLTENGQPATGTTAANLGRAKSIVLAIDRSRSMGGRSFDDAIAAARTFVGSKQKADRVQIIAFGKSASGVTRLTPAASEADAALRDLRLDGRTGTALWDAVVLAAQGLEAEEGQGHVIIVLTDGDDVSSKATFLQAVEAAQRAHASVYAIGIAGRYFTRGPLKDLAAKTGGAYLEASTTAELTSLYTRLSGVLARTWELRYPTSARPGDKLRLTAIVPGAGQGMRTVTLAPEAAARTSAGPSGLLPASAWRSTAATLLLSLVVGFLVLLACCFWFAARAGSWLRSRLDPHLGPAQSGARKRKPRSAKSLTRSILAMTERALEDMKHFRALERLLVRADLPLRAVELLYICLGGSVIFGGLSAALGAPTLVTLLLLGLGGALPVLFVRFKAGARVKAFDNQLPDLLITIAASLKAGHSFRQAVQSVVDEGAEPAAKEFKRVITETRLGRPMDAALSDMAERVGSKNLSFVITAVTIQRQIGGSLAGLFDMVAETVRQRQQFARKIRGLTAMGRMSAYVLAGLPFFITLAITALNPTYMAPLYNTATGQKLIALGLTMIAVGSVILKRIVSFKA
jgi:tight adherence protein B